MGLLARFTRSDSPVAQPDFINWVEFSSFVILVANGKKTVSDLESYFGLDATEQQQLSELIAVYQSLPANQKGQYITVFGAVLCMRQNDPANFDANFVKSSLGITTGDN